MITFKIATWNVNSMRVRLPHVLTWLNEKKPDVLALQEIKLSDEDFPFAALQEAGYTAITSGQRTYNGVAILISKTASIDHPTDLIKDLPQLEDAQRRVLAVTLGDIRIVNLYVPNGESLSSAKFQYKLNWLNRLDVFLKQELSKYTKIIVLGDFNIAPQEIDVHDPKFWEGQIHFTPKERDAFQDLLRLGFNDCFRRLHPDEKVFSWWDYRMGAFRRNMGLRIDHILASQQLVSSCVQCEIDKEPRSLERPSDHVPVFAHFNIK